jgi:hypothetical protein
MKMAFSIFTEGYGGVVFVLAGNTGGNNGIGAIDFPL